MASENLNHTIIERYSIRGELIGGRNFQEGKGKLIALPEEWIFRF